MEGNNFPYQQYDQQYGRRPEDGGAASKRPNLLKQFAYSFLPSRYRELMRVKTGGMIGFITLLTLISTIYLFLVFVFAYLSKGGADGFWDFIPEFELQNGRLSMNEEYIYDRGRQYVYITDQTNGFRRRDAEHLAEQGYSQIILAGSERVCVMQYDEYVEYAYADLRDDPAIDRDWLVAHLAPIFWIVVIIGFLFFFVGRTFWYFLCAAVYWLCALLMAALLHKKVRQGVLFKTAVYAKAPMFVIAMVLNMFLLGFLRIAVTLIFLGLAVRRVTEDEHTILQ